MPTGIIYDVSQERIKGPGTDYYKHMDSAVYERRINTPAKSPEYFEQFHKPLVERAKERFGTPIHVLDIACGPANELEFFKNDPDVIPIATDISEKILQEAKDKIGEKAHLFASDVTLPAIRENSVEAGMLVNAMVYVPDKMLSAMHQALKPGGECVVNLRLFNNIRNKVFYGSYAERGGNLFDRELTVDIEGVSHVFKMKVLDYTECVNKDGTPDLEIRQLGQQMYFQSVEDVEKLIKGIGYEIVDHKTFQFASPVNPKNEVDVYTLQKPLT
ncbi:class I SAM-dependent methyltransferase [Candidatus Parcubacteria bacterium]|nr:MAG: class I SAM-dependent methyltransferase [Candidatus Parcubacteria bacterium]